MENFTKSDFERLAEVHNQNCLSIYIPTHRKNAEGNGIYKDKTTLKNQLKEARKQLSVCGRTEEEIAKFLQPVWDLIEDVEFWSHQAEGLAIFYHGEELRTYSIAKSFDTFTYVSSHYYLKPLANIFQQPDQYFVMVLSLEHVKLYEASKAAINEVDITDYVPKSLEDVVGHDYEDKHLQQRSGQGERGQAEGLFHAHGVGSESEKKREALKYFRAVDQGLVKLLHDKHAPLIIACVDYLFPIYKEANSYKYLQDQHLSGNYENESPLTIKESSWEIMSDNFEKEVEREKDRYHALLNEQKATAAIETVVPAAINGRAETLFVQKGEEVWGKYTKDQNKVEIDAIRNIGDTGLLNLAAVETVKQGGRVYELPSSEMPADSSPVNAVFRYSY